MLLLHFLVKIKQTDPVVFGLKYRVPRGTIFNVEDFIGQRKDVTPRVIFDVPNTRKSMIRDKLQCAITRWMYKTSAISFDYVDRFLISATVAFMNEIFWHSNVAYLVRRIASQKKRKLIEPLDSSIIRLVRLHRMCYCKVLISHINCAFCVRNQRDLSDFVVRCLPS